LAGGFHIVTRGIVLREKATREADKILTLLTEDEGKIPVVARGVRRKNCAYAASAQPLVYSEWTLYQRGEWYYSSDAQLLELFRPLREDLELLALGSYFAELVSAVSETGPESELLRHLLNGLYALSELKKPQELVKPAFELKLLSLAGYEPLADGCAYCGKEDPDRPMLDVVQGVVRCASCGRGQGGLAMPLCEGSLAALRRVLYGPPRRLYSFTLKDPALERFAAAAETFTVTQLERNFRTLDFYKSLKTPAAASGDREENI